VRWGEIDNAAVQVAQWNGTDLVLSLARGDFRDRPLTEIEGLLLIADPVTRPYGCSVKYRQVDRFMPSARGANRAAPRTTVNSCSPSDCGMIGRRLCTRTRFGAPGHLVA
jgi:hypothetical protein